MKYQSQNRETEIVLGYFNGYVGTLAELGSNDGLTLSNSYDLIQQGWSAHLVEASPTCIEKSILLHADNDRVHHHNFAIYTEDCMGTLHESGAHFRDNSDYGLLSTVVPTEKGRWPGVGFKEVDVPFISFDTFYQHIGNPVIEYISCDVEGLDWQILQQINLSRVGCRCLCIEWNGKMELWYLFSEYCKKHGMKETHRNGENLIFVR